MAAACGISLESYIQIYKALTKGNDKVQAVTPIEECYYKAQDLKQVLAVHGLSASKFNRTELLQALKGRTLVNPFDDMQRRPVSLDQQRQQAAPAPAPEGSSSSSAANSSSAPSGADLMALGWADAGADIVVQPMQQLSLDLLEGFQDLPAVGTAVTEPGAVMAASCVAAAVHEHRQLEPNPSSHSLPHQHQPQQQQMEARHPAATGAAAAVPAARQQHSLPTVQTAAAAAEGWQTTKRTNTDSSMPDAAPQQHTLPVGQAVPVQADAPGAAMTGTGQQHRTTAAAATAIIKSMQGQTVSAVGTQQMHTTPAPRQQQNACAQLCHPAQAPPQQQQEPQQAAADEESANETAAEDDYLQPSSAEDADRSLTAAPAAAEAAHPLTQLLQDASLQDAKHVPPQPHTPWLLQQLQVFAAAGAVASEEDLPAPTAVAAASLAGSMTGGSNVLLGRHVGFVLTEEMSVAGTKGKQLTMPAGVYQGHVLQYLGASCQPELCEPSCPGNHQHYRARVIPPQLPDKSHIELLAAHDTAAGIAQAQAAAAGRPVRLILDLHPRLRCQKLADMLGLNNNKLQDAWILLKEERQPSSSFELQDDEAPDVASTAVARGRGRGRGSRGGRYSQQSVGHGPRIKRAKH